MTKAFYDTKTNQWWTETEDTALVPTQAEAPAEMRQFAGALKGLANFDPMGLPLGAAGAVSVVDYVKDRLLGERLAQWGALGGLGVAWAVKNYGKGVLGTRIADATALLLTYEAIRDTVGAWLDSVWPAQQAQAADMAQGVANRAQASQRQPGYYERILARDGR